jgi:hypothetical protein
MTASGRGGTYQPGPADDVIPAQRSAERVSSVILWRRGCLWIPACAAARGNDGLGAERARTNRASYIRHAGGVLPARPVSPALSPAYAPFLPGAPLPHLSPETACTNADCLPTRFSRVSVENREGAGASRGDRYPAEVRLAPHRRASHPKIPRTTPAPPESWAPADRLARRSALIVGSVLRSDALSMRSKRTIPQPRRAGISRDMVTRRPEPDRSERSAWLRSWT